MDRRIYRWAALALCWVALTACKDKHEPLKPTVGPAAVSAPAAHA